MGELSSPARSWRDFVEITKPRVVSLMLLTALVGMFLSMPTMVPLAPVSLGILGIALVAASAAAVNHIADAQIDARMARTEHRPAAMGRVGAVEGLLFSAALGLSGFLVLYVWVNPLTAWLNVASWVGYALVYTLCLKRATPQNIVLGGLFGAAPPVLGWAAITGEIATEALLLTLIIFVWTPPHFWSLALDRKDEYAKANIPMLPVTHGVRATRLQVLVYTLALLVVSLMPFLIGMASWLYLGGAVVLGAGFLRLALLLFAGNERAPKALFRYSVIYLALLFLALVVDHALTMP
ncbi:MAG: heme o synthase [Pseudomonadales bacterium]|nr:heme o synthase [Pseudomonadales bacterium]